MCVPDDPMLVKDSLGDLLIGSKLYYSNYFFNLNKHVNCKLLCKKKISYKNYDALSYLIKNDYSLRWNIDSIPAGIVKNGKVDYNKELKVGYMKNNKYYIYNHYRFYIKLNKYDEKRSHIVGFELEPFSIRQRDKLGCAIHNHYSDINTDNAIYLNSQDLEELEPQIIDKDEEIAFSYDILFQYTNITFSSRFDHFKNINSKIHWMNIIYSNIIVFSLAGLIIFIFIRAIKNDIEIYNTKVTEEDFIDEYGWKGISGDVFRRPIRCELLCAIIGNGFQLLIMLLYTLTFLFFGLDIPEVRSRMISIMLIIFIFLSLVGGYIGSRVYRFYRGYKWVKLAIYSSIIFPEFCFFYVLLVSWIYKIYGTNVGMSFTQLASIMFLWVGCSTPLAFTGTFLGYSRTSIRLPCKVNPVPTQLLEKPWYLHLKYSIWIAGFIPFASVFIEIIYIMSSIWKNNFYTLSTFLLIGIFVLVIISAEIGFIYVFANLCKGDYNWCWKCFLVCGSPILYVFIYSIYYYHTLKTTTISAMAIYFGLIGIICIIIVLICGSVGIILTFFILLQMYANLKFD